MQLGAFGFARQGRLQKRDGGITLAGGAQQVGEIDDGLLAARFQRQDVAEELFGRSGQSQQAGGIAKRE